jgi:hypothetical protein
LQCLLSMIRVFEYGCLKPVAGESIAIDQMRRKQQLWNKFVEIENATRTQAAMALSDDRAQQNIQALQTTIAALRTEIKRRRQAARFRKVDISDLKSELEEKKQALRAAIELERTARKQRVQERRAELDSLNAGRKLETQKAVHEAGLYWCNYDEVVASYYKVARKKKVALRFHAWRGEGKVSVRYQTGLPVPEAFQSDTRLQIRPLTQEELGTKYKNPKARHLVSLRVGSEKRAPVWFQLPVVLHRPLPDGGTIRSASVARNIVGGIPRYKLLVTVDDGIEVSPKRRTGQVCAVDLGWRRVPAGLRVAYWGDLEGGRGEVLLDNSVLFEFDKCRDLQSIIDKRFEEVKAFLAGADGESWPAQEELATIAQWRSPGRLVRWIRNANRAGFRHPELDAWVRKQMHLYTWVSNLREQAGKRRREIYRRFAAWLAQRYDTVLLEEFDLRKIAETPQPEADDERSYANHARFVAAVSELRLAIVNACEREGTAISKRDAKYSTQDCHVCRGEAAPEASPPWNQAESVIHQCEQCQSVWDQDDNAVQNLLAPFRRQEPPASTAV